MRVSLVVATALCACVLGVAACGDDDDDDGGGSTAASTQESPSAGPQTFSETLPPASSKPNVVGGNAPIDQFALNVFSQASAYWSELATANNIPYPPLTAAYLSQPGEACGQPFDPASRLSFLCANTQTGGQVTYSLPQLDQIRTEGGDAAAAFALGWTPAVDINNFVSGNDPIANNQLTDAFWNRTACFEGSWVKWLGDKQILEAGDSQEIDAEVLKTVPGAAPPELKMAAVKFGYDNGPGGCQQQYPDAQ
jgi:hypothetical protein